MKIYGLIGKSLQHSFSQGYFLKKFNQKNLNACYVNFELSTIDQFRSLPNQIPELTGLNVTIPYKETVIPFLDALTEDAKAIGAVNVIQFKNNQLIGHNTDWIGFTESLKKSFDITQIKSAVILGSGGASKAIEFSLHQLGIETAIVSSSGKTDYDYDSIPELLDKTQLIVNCTPLGTYPNVTEKPPMPYSQLNSSHYLFDLIYNPEKTAFMKEGKMKGCQVKNGYGMLINQAEAAWNIWES